MFRPLLSALLLALCCATPVGAAIRFDRNTTLTDASGGTMITRSSGDFARRSGSAVSEAVFQNFAPRDRGGSVNGSINQTRDREGRRVTLRYDGNITMNLPADSSGQTARTVAVTFHDLSVLRSEDGRKVDGNIVINGQEMPVKEAPRSIIAILIGLTKLMRV